MSPSTPPPVDCRNCGAMLAGPFCHRCGQKRLQPADRRLAHLLGQFLEALTDLDSRFWRSLRALLLQPGRLSRDYLDGRRARYMAPVSLFLIANALYFLWPAISDFGLDFYSHASPAHRVELIAAQRQLDAGERERILAEGAQLHSPLTAQWVDRRVAARDAASRAAGGSGYTLADYRRAYDARNGEISKLLIVLHVPFLALLLMALFPRRGLYYGEHFVVALHLFTAVVFYVQLVLLPTAAVAQHGFGVQQFPAPARLAVALLLFGFAGAWLRRVHAVGWLRGLSSGVVLMVGLFLINATIYRMLQFAIVFALS